jgi:hypothetical protein
LKTIAIPQLPSFTPSTSPFLGYQLGAFYKTKLANHLSLAAEANFSVIGSSMTLVGENWESYDTNEKLGYIEIPVTIQYEIKKFYFGAGPGVGFNIFSKLKGFEEQTANISDYQTIDASGNVLVGYGLLSKMDINLRYSHGLVNLYKDPGYAVTKNRFFNFSVLYYLK